MWKRTFFARARTPPTREKHALLVTLLGTWLKARPRGGSCVVFDGFAGAGSFGDQAPGSPLLILELLASASAPAHVHAIFVEKDAQNHALLTRAVAETLAGLPSEARARLAESVEVHHASFVAHAQAVTALAPGPDLFSFVDPYTHEGVSFAALASLCARGALLFHCPSHALYTKLLSRNGDSPEQARRMEALFGPGVSWSELRAFAATHAAEETKEHLANALASALAPQGAPAQVHPLRGGGSHLLFVHSPDT